MSEFFLTVAAITSVCLWSALMIAVGVYGQRLRYRQEQQQRIARLIADAKRQQTVANLTARRTPTKPRLLRRPEAL